MTELDPRIAQYLGYAAMSAGYIGRKEDAAALGDAAVLAAPQSRGAKLAKGIALVRCGEYTNGADFLREAVLAETPDHVTAMLYVGLAEHRLGNTAERDTMWDAVMGADESDPRVQSAQKMISDELING